jgi:hypothetical protein
MQEENRRNGWPIVNNLDVPPKGMKTNKGTV